MLFGDYFRVYSIHTSSGIIWLLYSISMMLAVSKTKSVIMLIFVPLYILCLIFLSCFSDFFLSQWLVTFNDEVWLSWAEFGVIFLSSRLDKHFGYIGLCCCYSVAKSCLSLCSPMDGSTPGFPVLQHLLEFAQTYVHWVSDAI